MKLKSLVRSLILVGTNPQVPAARSSDALLVAAGTRLVPSIYEELRTRRRIRSVVMAVAVGLPTLIAAVYYGLIASPRFVSDTQMVLSEQDQSPADLLAGAASQSPLLSLAGISGASSAQISETAIVTSYLMSSEVMDAADKAIGLRHIWSGHSVDAVSRLSANATEEDFYKYYQKRVAVISDPTQPVIEVSVEAFHPQDAQLIAKTLVKLAQDKLNGAFVGMREDALKYARSEVTATEQQLESVNDRLRSFRNAHSELDPTASAQGVGMVTTALFAQLANDEAELRATMSYAQDDSPAVETLKSRIAALKKQIADNRSLLAGNPGEKPYADLLANYEDLLLEQKFAQASYTSAMAFLSSSRASLAHQHSYLIDFLAPTLPDEATEPHGARNVLAVFAASLLLWLTGSLVASALREHARR